ncbi:hypothetical protein [Micromonospora sp. NPDC049679]|uniref:hypothetical protein n=1 Tax=Micromonospora sp. NPDC049679 TaxID=3155920 RepID=UPI0033D5D3E1
MIGDADANGVKTVKLTRQAFDRLGIEMTPVRDAPGATAAPATPPTPGASPGGATSVVPYSAVLYDPSGVTWVYTAPRPLNYVREKVVVTTVGGSGGTEAVLSEGPPVGTMIVATGVMELYGAELGVGK